MRTIPLIWDSNCYNQCMDIYIGYDSALRFWRRQGRTRGSYVHRQRRSKLPSRLIKTNAASIERVLQVTGLELPLDILVAAPNARSKSRIQKTHVCSRPLPENSFISVGEGVYVSSPELCFFQMASQLTLIKLIELGFELCGSYTPSVINQGGENPAALSISQFNLPKLTDEKRIASLVERMVGVHGYKLAAKALPYIADGSNSPMETILTMLLTLPYRLGGYGLRMPSLNYPVVPVKALRRTTGRSHFRCDLFWPEEKLAVEYDSEEYHGNIRKIAEDAARRNVLTSLGMPPIIVTKQQLYSVFESEKIAIQLARILGKQLKHKKPGFSEARYSLRKSLL